VALQSRGNIDKAVKDYSNAIEKDPKTALYYCNRGRAYYVKGKLDTALSDLNEAIKLDPDYLDAYLVKGWTCEDMKSYQDAISAYRKVIAIDNSTGKEATKEAESAIKDLEGRMARESEKTLNDSKKDK
jgi:tetratricopeptide (TPR) repeat protein